MQRTTLTTFINGCARALRPTKERTLVESELRESEERYRRLAENAPDIIFRYELRPRRGVTYVSSAIIETLGYTPDELYADHTVLGRLVDPADYSALKATLRDPNRRGPVTVPLYHRDGRKLWAELRLVPLRGDGGGIVAVEGIVRDITDRMLVEQQLARSEKLNSLGVMASGVAHQMNNVLASIMGHADLLLQESSDPQARHYLDLIIRAAEDGAASVRRIQGFARSDPLEHPAPLDLLTVVDDAMEGTAPRWRDQAEYEGRRITVSREASSPVWVEGVVSELREVLMNLILNAVDALPTGGTIHIEIAPQSDGRVALRVTDSGSGMPEDVARRAFDPFFTTKPFGSGMGLGLALVHRIIERHQGSIEIKTALGRGTTFEITLPAASPPEPSAELTDSAPAAPLRILVVDDDAMLGDQLARVLRMDDHEVRVSRGGAEALGLLNEAEFDVVITDLGMPDVTGWDIARETRLRQPRARVGLVTGWGSELHEMDETRELVDFVVAKPYRINSIRAALANI